MSKDNLKLWESVRETDPKQTKKAKIGQMNITAICPQHQRKNATEKFGAYGIGWGIRPESESIVYKAIGETTLASYQSTMWYKYEDEVGEFPITSSIKVAYVTKSGSGYLKVDDEYMKKLQTDALTKGLSFLGFNSDIFEGLYDDNRYVQAMAKKFAQVEPEPIRQKYVDRAVEVYRECVDADTEEVDYKKMQDAEAHLTNDEKMAALDAFGSDKPEGSKRMYKNIIADCLKQHPADDAPA